MRFWLRIHRYLGVFCAPLLLMFAVSGAAQVWRLHQQRKNSSWTPPPALVAAADFHMAEDLGGTVSAQLFRWTIVGVAAFLLVTLLIGVAAAFKTSPRKMPIALTLLLGAALPLLFYLLAVRAAPVR